MFWNHEKWNIETTNKYSLFLFGFKIMPTEVALDFSNDVGLLLLVDVPALFVVFCVVEAVCKKITNKSKWQKNPNGKQKYRNSMRTTYLALPYYYYSCYSHLKHYYYFDCFPTAMG